MLPSGSHAPTFLVLASDWLASCTPMSLFLANDAADWSLLPAVPE